MTSSPVKILCVDDHAFVAEGLKARIDVEPDLEVVGWLGTADELIPQVRATGAAIVLMDIEIPGADPFDALSELRQQCPDVKAIMLSAFVRDHYIDAAYKAGAWGYLSKSDSPDSVIAGIRSVINGEPVFSSEVTDRSNMVSTGKAGRQVPAGSKLTLLTARERQILRMIAKGMSRTAIAEQLTRSPMTVDNHRKSIMRKLGINDRTELVRYAIAEGLVEV